MKIRYTMSGVAGTITDVEPRRADDEIATLHQIAARDGKTVTGGLLYDQFCHCPGEVIHERGGLTTDNRCPICSEPWA